MEPSAPPLRPERRGSGAGTVRAMGLADERYVRLTTFRRSGEAVSTPVWIVDLDDGRYGFHTSSGSGKAKRLAHTARVLVQASDARGRSKADAPEWEATAEVLAGGPIFDEVIGAVEEKYGWQVPVTRFLGTVGGILKRKRIPYADRAVVLRVAD